MSNEPITADEMRRRLAELCAGDERWFPKKQRDRHIVMAAATLWMEQGEVYNEREVTERLAEFLDVCRALQIDAVSLRRELVDHGYLDRDDAGKFYSAGWGSPGWWFAEDVASVDPIEIVSKAHEEWVARREARRAAYLG